MKQLLDAKKADSKISDRRKEKLESLRKIFPGVFKDGILDFDALKEELGEFLDDTSEKYEFSWSGKKEAGRAAQEDIEGKTLKYIPGKGREEESTQNIYIEGDNLEVLKLIRKNYYQAVKLIYIDPPYNTGSDFLYKDSFRMKQGEVAEERKERCSLQNRCHANWLNMMYPRLILARELLREDGAIFISIDDNEATNLLKLCDEVFGEENYAASFPWRKRTAKSDVPFGISQDYEQIICYAKTNQFQASVEGKGRRYYVSEDYPNRPWRIHDMTKQTTASERPNSYFTITDPRNGREYPANPNATWRITENTFEKYYRAGRIVFPGDYDFLKITRPVLRYWKEDDLKKAGDNFGRISVSTHLPSAVGMSQDGTRQIMELFGAKVFPFPKPVSLMKYILSMVNCEDALVMDFFSGSASMAHAVMEMNAEDGGTRRYIMVQMAEECDEKSEAYQSGYKTICELGEERIRRAGDKIRREKPDAFADLGFRVFGVADTAPGSADCMSFADDAGIVYELMLGQRGMALSESLKILSDIGSRTYLYAGTNLVCLETEITKELLDKLAGLEPFPERFVFRKLAFEGDVLLKDEIVRSLRDAAKRSDKEERPACMVEFI